GEKSVRQSPAGGRAARRDPSRCHQTAAAAETKSHLQSAKTKTVGKQTPACADEAAPLKTQSVGIDRGLQGQLTVLDLLDRNLLSDRIAIRIERDRSCNAGEIASDRQRIAQ